MLGSVKLTVNDCGSANSPDPAMYLFYTLIKNNYSGVNGVSNISVTGYTSAGTSITLNSASLVDYNFLFTNNPYFKLRLNMNLNCGSQSSCSITSIVISGNWGNLGWSITFNTSQCNISSNNGQVVPVYLSGQLTMPSSVTAGVGAQLGSYPALVNAIAFAGFWVEFWSEVISQIVPNSGIKPASWNSGSFITKLGILVVDSNNNVQLAYNAPGYSNTGVGSMSIQAGVLQQTANSFTMDYLINAVISSPKSFTVGSITIYVYYNVTPSSSSTTPIGLQGYSITAIQPSGLTMPGSATAIETDETVTMSALT
jgi:hypothetical protein